MTSQGRQNRSNFAERHGSLQMALEATVLIGRRWEWHQTIQLEIALQMIGQKLKLGQGHTKVMLGQIRSVQVKFGNATQPLVGHDLTGFI